jgi:hypothetical protein
MASEIKPIVPFEDSFEKIDIRIGRVVKKNVPGV